MITDEQFIEIVKEAVAKTSRRFVADELCASPPTIDRWMAGMNLPHQFVRGSVLKICGSVV